MLCIALKLLIASSIYLELNEIDKKITYEPLNNIDVIKIDEVIKKTEKHEPPYNKEEKIRKINNDIKEVLNEKLTKVEKSAIEKAYSKYDKVDYVIMTTVLIDDLKNRLDKAKEDYSLNKISIQEYRNRIKSIKESIEELGNINNKPYVREEIKRLREDIYTKKNDKYANIDAYYCVTSSDTCTPSTKGKSVKVENNNEKVCCHCCSGNVVNFHFSGKREQGSKIPLLEHTERDVGRAE